MGFGHESILCTVVSPTVWLQCFHYSYSIFIIISIAFIYLNMSTQQVPTKSHLTAKFT